MSSGYRFRAYPSKSVAQTLLRWTGCQRFIYNAKVREDRYFRAFQRRFADFAGQHAPVDQAYSHLIGDGAGNPELDTTWLRQVPSQVLRNGAARFYTAYKRFFEGLARRPTIQHRHGEQSLWLTSELFEFQQDEIGRWKLLLGTKKFPCGEMAFFDHRPGWSPPASIHISVNAGRWHVSFSNEGAPVPTEQEALEQLRKYSATELLERTVGIDRGVAIPIMASTGQTFALTDVQRQRLQRKEIQRRRWQRRAGRRVKGSANRRKANLRAAKAGLYAQDLRVELAHQASWALVKSDAKLFVVEDLKIRSMTSSAAGTAAEPGNRVRQKAGLNRAILGSAWGEFARCLQYKALEAGKLVVQVPPHHSSQECSQCGHTHADNRIDQSRFVCQRCGHTENADLNAARVLASRGAKAVSSGSYTLRKRKKVGGLRRPPDKLGGEGRPMQGSAGSSTVGQELSEQSAGAILRQTSVESAVSRAARKRRAHSSAKQKTVVVRPQETPTTRPSGV